ncbi:MAG: DUF1844 domain-containing protein [Thermoguttaceae bacterium]|jgi:hypothetical protein
MPDDKNEDKKKIIIDENWKSRVEAEKEEERLKREQGQTHEHPAESQAPLPPPTLSFLAGTLYLQGAIAMGLLPNPVSDKQPAVRIDQARHAIELLTMLQQKTEGNRTPEESEEIEGMLHQLRLAFITVTQK